MKQEVIKNFTRSLIKKTIIFVVLVLLVTVVGRAISPVISNDLALTQMQNSDEMFVLMNSYERIKSIVKILYCVITGWFAGTILSDIRYFTETMKNIDKEI